MINYILILISLFTLVACSSVDENIIKTSLPNNANLELHLFEQDHSYKLSILFIEHANENSIDPFVKTIEKIIIKPQYNDSLKMEMAFNTVIYKDVLSLFGIFIPEIKSDVVLSATRTLNVTSYDMEELTALNFEIYSKNEVYKIQVKKDFLYAKRKNNLKTLPVVISKDENKIELGIFAYRYSKPEEEYIPNSETIRLEVVNFKGKPVYNSQTGMNYMQVIMPVYPDSIGRTYLYQENWNFKDDEGNTIIPGKYTINMTIPAYPKPYRTELFYERK